MPDFTQSKVYKLVNDTDDEIYVGSTCGTLRRRKCGHKISATKHTNRRVYTHLNAVGWDNVRIVLLQSIACANRDELRAAEQHWIDLLRPSLNKNFAFVPDCEHGRQKYTCKQCGGSSICEHGRHRYACKPCGGAGICDHGRQRHRCKPCGGAGICEHGRQKYSCKPCGGLSICEHDRVQRMCIECSPFYCDYCEITYTKGNILRHYKTDKHKKSYVAAYIDAHDEQPTEFPFNQLVH
jgi:hypothetical protein